MHARDLNLQFSHHEATSLLVPRHNFKYRCFKQCKKYPRQGPSPSCRQNHDSPRRRKSSKDPPSVPLLECGIPQYLSMYRSLPTNLSPEPIGATIAPTGSHRSAPTADPYRTHTKTPSALPQTPSCSVITSTQTSTLPQFASGGWYHTARAVRTLKRIPMRRHTDEESVLPPGLPCMVDDQAHCSTK
jgi:hypothetical protein